MSGKILVHKLWAKMLFSNHIARFFDRQYLLKESFISSGFFLHEGRYYRKLVTKTVSLGMTILKIVPNERLVNFGQNKSNL